MAETAAKVEVEEPVILGKVAIEAVVPTRVEGYGKLPPGHYAREVGEGMPGTVNLLRIGFTHGYLVVLWSHPRRMFHDFLVTEGGEVRNATMG